MTSEYYLTTFNSQTSANLDPGQATTINVEMSSEELGAFNEEFLVSIDDQPFMIIASRGCVVKAELIFMHSQKSDIQALIDFGSVYNKTQVERDGILYNSSPNTVRWVAVNQNDAPGKFTLYTCHNKHSGTLVAL